jgi:carbamoyl-phosphate synthase small subunit
MSYLLLEDGELFAGTPVGARGVAYGEAVFATAMSGYQELVTDPSYAEQILCFTAPMIGNYGVGEERSESAGVQVRGVVMREARGPEWPAWLEAHGVVALTGVDTRSLVLHLRDRGAMRAAIVADEAGVEETLDAIRSQPEMEGRALVAGVSPREAYIANADGDVRVAVVDYGCKRSILRRLAAAGAAVTVLPHDVDVGELARYDGVVLSNGPGDPAALGEQVETIADALGRVPIFGICLGHQLLALATGHETYKLPFGHRGANHPVLDRSARRVLVTSQNHGFAVREGAEGAATHVSLYDGTVEGLAYPELRARSVQFHPEAGPGPHDAHPLLEAWVEELRDAA